MTTAIALGGSALLAAGLLSGAGSPAQAAPAGLAWSGCDSSLPKEARCATLTVPRDWDAPNAGPTYRIAVARIPATDPAHRIGVLTFNPGGPGSAGVSNITWVQSMLPPEVRARFDLVAWDPRGVGRSEPGISSCSVKDVSAPSTGPVNWSKWVAKYVKAQEAAARECLAVNGDAVNFINTYQIVHDVDSLRATLGEKTLTFWGMSYGSTVGRAYAQYFPTHVRALLLDGAISPVSTISSWAHEHIWDDPLAINTMLGALGPRYVKAYARVTAALDKQTLPYGGGRITRWEFGRDIISWASFQTTWNAAADLISSLDRATRSTTFRPSGAPAAMAGRSAFEAQYTYVDCADFPDRPTVAELTTIAEAAAGVGGPAVGQSALREGAQCAGLPRIGTPLAPITTPIKLATPPIVSNSIGDNRTPWSGARQVANAFVDSVLVGYGGTHHIIYGRTTSCVAKPITDYLLTLKLPRWPFICPLKWG